MIPHSNKFDFVTDREQWIEDNKHVCTIPYKETHYRLGYANPCCYYQPTQGLIAQPAARVKKHIESQQVDAFCSYCTKQEQNNQLSGRKRDLLDINKISLENFLTNKNFEEFSTTLVFSNKCNMACRMCSPGNSSLFGKLVGIKDYASSTISDNLQYWQQIKNQIRSDVDKYKIYRLTVTGGEGTLQDDLYRLTEWLYEENLSQKIHLQILTNGSTWLADTYKQWCERFQQLTFSISIDSVNLNYEYVRWPMQFDKIAKHLYQFAELGNQHNNFNYYFTPVFYANNVAYLPEWLDWFENFYKQGNDVSIFDGTLVDPNHYQILNLPTYIKQDLLSVIEPLPELNLKILDKNSTFRQSLNNIVTQLKTDCENSPEQKNKQLTIWKEYLKQTAKWDLLTNTSLPISNQKLWDRLNSQDQLYYRELLKQSL
jgi:organic radical activating enzyme